MNQPPPAITAPTLRDVLNGRGQGVQRHPGNVKYRTLVFVNKGLYAKCPRNDKMKISKGIVGAIRELGGRFLELDERTGIYRDIGDKKATEKTSQALREGQTKIRKQMYKDEEMAGGAPAHDTSLLTAAGGLQREISAEGYFGYSVQVLESLYSQEAGAAGDAAAPSTAAAAAASMQPPPLPEPTLPASGPAAIHLPAGFGQTGTNPNSSVLAALDQFPGAQMAPPPLPAPNAEGAPSIGRFTAELGRPSLGRLTNMTGMSMGSLFSSMRSIGDLLESGGADAEGNAAGEERHSDIKSVLTSEIAQLIRLSEPQLMEVDDMAVDDAGGKDHEDREITLMDAEGGGDRVSELRFTDVGGGNNKPGEPGPRLTDSTEATNNSDLMRDTIMSINTEDMSTATEGEKKVADMASAELLLRLSNDKKKEQGV
ncbi:hypothetical protein ACHAXT_011278 [Thalassiosira profunda]